MKKETGFFDHNGEELIVGDYVEVCGRQIARVCFENGAYGLTFSKKIDYERLKKYADEPFPKFIGNETYLSFYEILMNWNVEGYRLICLLKLEDAASVKDEIVGRLYLEKKTIFEDLELQDAKTALSCADQLAVMNAVISYFENETDYEYMIHMKFLLEMEYPLTYLSNQIMEKDTPYKDLFRNALMDIIIDNTCY